MQSKPDFTVSKPNKSKKQKSKAKPTDDLYDFEALEEEELESAAEILSSPKVRSNKMQEIIEESKSEEDCSKSSETISQSSEEEVVGGDDFELIWILNNDSLVLVVVV